MTHRERKGERGRETEREKLRGRKGKQVEKLNKKMNKSRGSRVTGTREEDDEEEVDDGD